MTEQNLKAIICDLDSTLFNTSHRQQYSPRQDPTATWESYADRCVDDVPFSGVRALIKILDSAGYVIVLVSSRPESSRDNTIESLEKHNIEYSHLYLSDGAEGDEEFKRNKALVLADYYDIELALEDWPHLTVMYESLGIPSICVNPFYLNLYTTAKYNNS